MCDQCVRQGIDRLERLLLDCLGYKYLLPKNVGGKLIIFREGGEGVPFRGKISPK